MHADLVLQQSLKSVYENGPPGLPPEGTAGNRVVEGVESCTTRS
jgi:hypothetical protein